MKQQSPEVSVSRLPCPNSPVLAQTSAALADWSRPYLALPAATQSWDYSFIAPSAFRVEHKPITSSPARSSVHSPVSVLSLHLTLRPTSQHSHHWMPVCQNTSVNPGVLWRRDLSKHPAALASFCFAVSHVCGPFLFSFVHVCVSILVLKQKRVVVYGLNISRQGQQMRCKVQKGCEGNGVKHLTHLWNSTERFRKNINHGMHC